MKSAYLTLGVPGNATREDIEAAYAAAQAFFTKERLVADPTLLQRREQVREAYKVLVNPELRQAHDRKLASASEPALVPLSMTTVSAQASPFRKLVPLLLLCLALYAAGQWWVARREAQRQQVLAMELEAKQLEAQKEAAEVAQRNQEAAEQRRKLQEDEARERQLRRDAQSASQQTQYIVNQQLQYQQQQTREEERAKLRAKQDEAQRQREAEYAAQKQQARDQAQLRNLCILNYGRPNC